MKKKVLEYDLKNIRERLNQLECSHPVGARNFASNRLPWIGTGSYYEECSSCKKTINNFDTYEDYNKAMIKWHREMIKALQPKQEDK